MRAIAYAMSVVVLLAGASMAAGDKMKAKLGLTDEQSQKLDAARKARQEAVEPLRNQMKQSMEKLREQVKSKASDSELQATLENLENNRKATQAVHEKYAADLKAILNPSQRAKMMVGMGGREKRMGMGKGKEKRDFRGGRGEHGDHADHGDHQDKE